MTPIRILRHCLPALAAAGLALASLNAAASTYSQLYVFGDSLSDNGNAYALTGGGFPPAPYAGTFSNGPVAAQYLAGKLGATLNDYAVGGAMTGSGNYLAIDIPALAPVLGNTGISSQIAAWSPSASFNAGSALFMVWGGPNDLSLGFDQAAAGASVDFGALISSAVGNIANGIVSLHAKGAHDFLVPYLPDLGLTPRGLAKGASFAAQATYLSNAFNSALAGTLAGLEGALGVQIHEFDTAQFMRDTIAAPSGGLSDVTSPCLAGGAAAIGTGCAGYLFFDDIHPTTLGHALIANAMAQAVPEPLPVLLLLAGLGVIGIAARRQRQ